MTTIYALSSGHGKSGVAVIRVSGPKASDALTALAGDLPPPRIAVLRKLHAPVSTEILDRSLIIWFPGPASFTGEDVFELHVHGGRAVIDGVFRALSNLPDLRIAEPGEFTRRAFENDKIDLTEAEGLADLIDAETEAQKKQALRQSSGSLRAIYEGWRTRLVHALANIEAELDFSDEGDVPQHVADRAHSEIRDLRAQIAAHLNDRRGGEILRDGFRVVIAGPPNAGKSSLMNALARRDVAIVSEQAGTTRDVIEVRLDLGGFPVILMDTAGIREAASDIEQEGVRRTLERAKEADLVLWIEDVRSRDTNIVNIAKTSPGVKTIKAYNKIDLINAQGGAGELGISVRTGAGLDALIVSLTDAAEQAAGIGENPAITRARHRNELESCCVSLENFLSSEFSDLELRAEDLRLAATSLGRLTGRVDVEDILDRIFADFCIGK